jgi:hypothetical protein
MRPLCPPAAATSATGTTIVEPVDGVIVTDLSLQNLTVTGADPKPVPEIVNEPPAPNEITEGDIAAANGQSGRVLVINVGGTAVSVERLTVNP